jgi:hypothetical protein
VCLPFDRRYERIKSSRGLGISVVDGPSPHIAQSLRAIP